jgi:hypothetical protein
MKLLPLKESMRLFTQFLMKKSKKSNLCSMFLLKSNLSTSSTQMTVQFVKILNKQLRKKRPRRSVCSLLNVHSLPRRRRLIWLQVI